VPGVLAVAVDGVVIVRSGAWLVAVLVVAALLVAGVVALLVAGVAAVVMTGVVTVLWVPAVGVVSGLCLAHVRSIPRKKRRVLGLNGCDGDARHRLDIPRH
jgi:hypothetical protein